MPLTVATNSGALMAQAAASSVNKEMELSMERLSTGKRINSAADDAAGVAIASRLEAEIRGTNQAIRNAMDAQALIDTAEGAHDEVNNLLQRMREVAVQAANDTNDSNDRSSLTDELTALTAEVDRIANVTSWAGQILLDGATPDASADDDTGNASFTFHIGARKTAADYLSVNISAIGSTALGIAGSGNGVTSLTDVSATGNSGSISVSQASSTIDFSSYSADETYKVKINGTTVTIATDSGTDKWADSATGIGAQAKVLMDAANIAGMVVTDNGDGTVSMNFGTALDIASATAARTAINTIDAALVIIASNRADLGAVSNRLDSTVANLTNISTNLQEGKGRIEDADFAAETTNLARTQILQQASTAMLAQANAAKQNVLSLLQG